MPKVTMVYWKGEQFWLGKILEHPEIMSQGESLEELEENLKDAYRLLVRAPEADARPSPVSAPRSSRCCAPTPRG